jgi:hypothetical protein
MIHRLQSLHRDVAAYDDIDMEAVGEQYSSRDASDAANRVVDRLETRPTPYEVTARNCVLRISDLRHPSQHDDDDRDTASNRIGVGLHRV